MEQSVNEAWKRLLDEARRELPEATVRTWLEPSEPIALDDGRLILGAPDQFAAEWNESKHASMLARVAERVLGRPTTVVFRVQEDRQRRPQMDFFVAPRESTATAIATNIGTTPLNERYSFQSFVIGKSNELAAAAAHAVAEAPGKTYNPLFIYGATGQGKGAGGVLPHLQRAVRGAQADRPDLGPAAQGDPGAGRPAHLALRVGDGGRHRASRSRASHRDLAEKGGAGPPRAHDPGRRAALHRGAYPLQRPRARGVHHQAAAVCLAQEPRSHDRAGARGALGQDPPGRRGGRVWRRHPVGAEHRPRSGGRGPALGRDAGGTPLQSQDQDAHRSAPGRDVPRARHVGHAARGDRAGVRLPRSLHGDSQRRQGRAADDARPDVQRAHRDGAAGMVRIVANNGGVGKRRRCEEWGKGNSFPESANSPNSAPTSGDGIQVMQWLRFRDIAHISPMSTTTTSISI